MAALYSRGTKGYNRDKHERRHAAVKSRWGDALFSYLSQLNITDIIIRVFVVLIAMTFHEVSHGYAAYKLGDPTAKSMGRLSWNPIKHIDPIGAICMILFRVGWAKPVMVNPSYFKKPKRDMALVSLAGPLANFIMAFAAMVIYRLCARFLPAATPMWLITFLQALFINLVALNVGLGAFNLLPIPPLDGSKIFLSLLPDRLYYDIMRYEQFGWIILVVALGLGVLDPIINVVINAIMRAMLFLVSWI